METMQTAQNVKLLMSSLLAVSTILRELELTSVYSNLALRIFSNYSKDLFSYLALICLLCSTGYLHVVELLLDIAVLAVST